MKALVRFVGVMVCVGCFASFTVAQSLQVTGAFPSMDGGFEAQTLGVVPTASSIATGVQSTTWTTSSASLAWIYNASSVTGVGPRTGNNFVKFWTTSTTKRLQSPTAANQAVTSGGSYIIQYYYLTRGTAAPGGTPQMGASSDGTGSPGTYRALWMPGTNGVWVKKDTAVAAGTSTASPRYGIEIARFSIATTDTIYIDDMVMYPGTTYDYTAPDPATAPSTAFVAGTQMGIQWTAPGTGVDGGGYMVVRGTSDPTTTPNVNGVYAVGNTVAPGEQVVYLGTNTSFTDMGLSELTTYYYRIYTVDKAFNYSTPVTFSAATVQLVPAALPTVAASAVNFSSVTQTGMTIGWTIGDGASRIVVMRAGGAVNSNPQIGSTYAASTTFGSGAQLGNGNYVVYNGTGSTVSVTGLSKATMYSVAVFEYNGSSGVENYLTTTPGTGVQASMPGIITSNATGGGVWGTASTWIGSAVPTASDSVIIASSDTVTLSSAGSCYSLNISSATAKLYTNVALPTSSLTYLSVYGPIISVTGVLGDKTRGATATTNDAIGINFYGNTTIVGGGVINPARIRPGASASNVTLTIDANVTMNYGGSTGTGGAALYTDNSGNDNITFTVNSGRTVSFADYANLATSSSSANGGASTTFNVNGTVSMPGLNSNLVLAIASGKTCALNIGPSGAVNVAGQLSATSYSGGGVPVIADAGQLTVGRTADFSSATLSATVTGSGSFVLNPGATILIGALAGLDPVSGPIRTTSRTFSPTAYYSFNGTSATMSTGSDLPAEVARLIARDTLGTITLTNSELADTLSLQKGVVVTGSKVLTVKTPVLSASSISYVEGNLALPISPSLNLPATLNWPLGKGSQYLPFTAYVNTAPIGSDVLTIGALDRTVTPPITQVAPANMVLKRFYRVTLGSGITSLITDSVKLSYSHADLAEFGLGQDTLKVFGNGGSGWGAVPIKYIDTAANIISILPSSTNSSDLIIAGTNLLGVSSYSSTSLDIGGVTVGFNKTDSSLVLTNSGANQLNVTSVASSDPQFSALPSSFNLAPGGTQKLFITFAPTSVGAKSAKLVIASNGQATSDTLSLAGTGVLPTIAFDNATKSFGSVLQSSGKQDSVTVTNSGPGILVITGISSDNADFVVNQIGGIFSKISKGSASHSISAKILTANYTLQPGQGMKVYLTFTPSTLATINGHIVFTSNTATSPDTVFVSGVGSTPGFGLSTYILPIGKVRKGLSRMDSATISNTGTIPLNITAVTSDVGDFTVSPTSASIAASGSQVFYVTFAPTSLGAQSANIRFAHDGSKPADTLVATGTGILPAFAASTQNRDLGSVFVGKSKQDSLYIKNIGTDTLHLSNVAHSQTQFGVVLAGLVQYAIAPADSEKVYLAFSPTAVGLLKDTIVVSHDGPSVRDSLFVSGTGVQSSFAAAPSTIAFGSVGISATKKDSVVVTNGGTGNLVIDSIRTGNAVFTVTPTSASVAPAGTQKFYFNFSPTASGAASANVVFYHNAPTVKDTVKVSGTGAQAAFGLSTTSIAFGGVLSGQTRKDSVIITNAGLSTLTIDSVRSNSAAFAVSPSTSASVLPSGTYKVYITFGPTSVAALSGKVVFYHNAPSRKDTLSVSGNGISQTLFSDDFTATSGTALTSAGWTISGTTTTNPISTTSGSLSFGKFSGSGVGNSVALQATGQDIYNTFPYYSSGSIYLSFMVNVSAVGTGDYFIALSPSSAQTNYYARLHVKSSGSGYVVGISKSNEVSGGAQYGSAVLSLNATNLIVVKYTFVAPATAADTANDPISVFVFTTTVPTTEPATPEIASYATNTKGDAANLGFITLRQGTTGAAPTLQLDGIRVGLTWTAGVPTGVVDAAAAGIPDSYGLHNNYPNPFNPSTTIQYDLPSQSRVTLKVYSLLGQEVRTLVDNTQSANYYRIQWNGRDNYGTQVSSGVYFFRMIAQPLDGKWQTFMQVKKMLLMK